MRRRTLLVVLAGLAVVVAAGVVVVWPLRQPAQLSEENCRRIRRGMTRSDVESILGPPRLCATGPTENDFGQNCFQHVFEPESYVRDRMYLPAYASPPPPADPVAECCYWDSDSAGVRVDYVRSGKVASVEYTPLQPRDKSVHAALLRPFKRQWQRWFPE